MRNKLLTKIYKVGITIFVLLFFVVSSFLSLNNNMLLNYRGWMTISKTFFMDTLLTITLIFFFTCLIYFLKTRKKKSLIIGLIGFFPLSISILFYSPYQFFISDELEDEIQTIEVCYVKWACSCPRWVQLDDLDKAAEDTDLCMYMEPAFDSIRIPDSIRGSARSFLITGQFYENKQMADDEFHSDAKAKTFRYTSFKFIEHIEVTDPISPQQKERDSLHHLYPFIEYFKKMGLGTDTNRIKKLASYAYSDLRHSAWQKHSDMYMVPLISEESIRYKYAGRNNGQIAPVNSIAKMVDNGIGFFFVRVDSNGIAPKNSGDFCLEIWQKTEHYKTDHKDLWSRPFRNFPYVYEEINNQIFILHGRSSYQYKGLVKLMDSIQTAYLKQEEKFGKN